MDSNYLDYHLFVKHNNWVFKSNRVCINFFSCFLNHQHDGWFFAKSYWCYSKKSIKLNSTESSYTWTNFHDVKVSWLYKSTAWQTISRWHFWLCMRKNQHAIHRSHYLYIFSNVITFALWCIGKTGYWSLLFNIGSLPLNFLLIKRKTFTLHKLKRTNYVLWNRKKTGFEFFYFKSYYMFN